jgi:hypothetical protein
MKNAICHRAFDLCFGPSRMAIAKTHSHQLAHAPIHPQRLFQSLTWSKGPVDRHLPFVSESNMVGFSERSHDGTLVSAASLARAGFTPESIPKGRPY